MGQIYNFQDYRSFSKVHKSQTRERRRKPPETKGIHTCTTCGHSGPWTKNWRWWGSYKDIDDGRAVEKFCSKHCALESKHCTEEGWDHPDDE